MLIDEYQVEIDKSDSGIKINIFNELQKPKLNISSTISRFLLRPFYLLLKNDMIKRLSEKHGEQFIDDVMETFDIPTNLMNKYFKK